MIIAMMSNTYSKRLQQNDEIWKIEIFSRIIRYEKLFPELWSIAHKPHKVCEQFCSIITSAWFSQFSTLAYCLKIHSCLPFKYDPHLWPLFFESVSCLERQFQWLFNWHFMLCLYWNLFQVVHMSHTEFWVGWLKNIALVLYCSPELHFCTRLFYFLVRSASMSSIHTQVLDNMVSVSWWNRYSRSIFTNIFSSSSYDFQHCSDFVLSLDTQNRLERFWEP